ncbi:GSCFA domain-containing protein [Carboxylicivirga linearis]|uniref:GSCFA domain-containing protein n=1 Tax=Carboxylicivirga linearis TaxID=1628157 RepID=A0ABS5JSI5_9BACT|nr:GSCFA domain-containing protein [Carboxylicivirga linearis]MBS2097797.1 GSCFA domain-containing protein [Carboxylicivirga linearis]
MDTFRTIVEVESQKKTINYNSQLLFMGSCFAGNIGSYFEETGFNAMVNPFGVLYNPFSIAKAIRQLIRNSAYQDTDLIYHNEIWQSFDHHSSFNNTDKASCLSNINETLKTGADFLANTDYLFITFGTSWVYKLKESGEIVSNCHKIPSSHFNRELITKESIIETYQDLFKNLLKLNPSLKIILTISPVRHWKDGAHGNQISKAILLLAVDELCTQFEQVDYFPAYEILLDDLRDYRFFDTDMLHPSAEAVKYIRAQFILSWLDELAQEFITQMESIKRNINHRPFNKHSDQHQKFIRKSISKLEQIQKRFNKVSLSTFQDQFNKQLL